MNAKPNLGRGLSALLGDEISVLDIRNNTNIDNPRNIGYRKLPIAMLNPRSDQPRNHFDEDALQELATSLKNTGMLQPILVCPTKNHERFEIVAGERRWRAAQKAGLHEVPVIIREMDLQEILEISLVENMQREDLNPIEEAKGLTHLKERFGYTQEMLAERIGKSRSAIANSLRLLNLSESVLKLLEKNSITAGHARILIGLDEAKALAIANQIATKNLSVRVVESMVAKSKKNLSPNNENHQEKNPNIIDQERFLQENLGIKVGIEQKNKGGKITLHFSDQAQYRQIIEKLTA